MLQTTDVKMLLWAIKPIESYVWSCNFKWEVHNWQTNSMCRSTIHTAHLVEEKNRGRNGCVHGANKRSTQHRKSKSVESETKNCNREAKWSETSQNPLNWLWVCWERERDGKPTYKLSQRINEWATTTHEQRASLTSIRDMLMVSCALWEQRWFVCRYAVFLRSFEGILPLASQPNNQLLNSVLSSSIQTERYVPFKTHFCGLRVVETIHRTAEW